MAQARVMFLGDSLVAGDEGNPVGHRSFRGRLMQLLAQGNYDVSVVGSQTLAPAIGGDPDHEGYAGSTIAAMRARIATILAGPVTVEIIVVLIGWVDVIANTASIGAAYTGMVDDITTAKPSAKVAICTLPPYYGRTEGETGATYPAYATLNTAIRGKTGSSIVLCDLASLSGTGNERSKYINDLIYESTHPSDSLRAGADGNQVYSDPWGGARYLDWQSVVDAVSAWQDPPPGGLPSWAGSSFAPRGAGAGHPYFMNNASALYPWVHGWLAAGHTAVNTGVEYRNLAAGVVTTSGQWIELFAGARIAGYFWNYDQIVSFGAVPPGCTFRQQPDGITTFWRAVGMYSPEGWPIDRVPSAGPALQTPGPIKGVNRAAIASAAGFYCVCQARLALDDPNGPDDRSQARYMVRVGADLYAARPDGTFWHDVNNTGGGRYDYVGYPRQTADFGGGRNRVLSSTEWTTIGFLTMRPQGFNPGLAPPWASGWPENPYGKEPYGLTEAQIRANPPPLPSFWTSTTSAAGLAASDYSPAQTYLMSQSGADRLAQAIYDRMVASTILAGYVVDSSGGTTPLLAAGASRSPRYNYQRVQPGDTLYSYEEAEVTAAQPPTWNLAGEVTVVIGGSASGTVAATGSPTYSKVSGPPWLTINSSTGALGGTATDTSPTIYNAVLRATNAAGTADLEILIRVVEGVSITTTSMPGGAVGTAYLALIAVAGTGPFTWSLDSASSASLAAIGLSLGGGSVFGSDPIAGTATFTVRATDPGGAYDEATLTITIGAAGTAPTITTTSLPTGTVSTAYSASIAADGRGPFDWSLEAGSLPPGLSLVPALDWDVALTGAALRAAIGDPTKYHAASRGWVIPGEAAARVTAAARSSVAWQLRADGSYEVAPHNLLPGSYVITTANGWSKGANITEGGLSGTLNGWPAYLYTSTAASNSFVNRSITVEVGCTYTVRFWCNATGAGWVTMGVTNRAINYTKTLLSAGLYEWTATFTAAATETTAAILVGVVDAANGTAWRVSAPQVCIGSVACAHVPTHDVAVFGPAVDWISADGGAYEIESDEARTQLWTYSANPTAGGWTVGPNLTSNGADGTLAGFPAYRYTSVAAGNSYIAQTNSCAAGEVYTASFISDFGPSTLGSGSRYLVTTPSNTQFTYTATQLATGVWEWSVTFTIPTGDNTLFGLIGNVDGGAGTTWRIAQPQLVAGARKPGKVVSWGNATVTRAADAALIPDTSPSFISGTAGTLLARFRRNSVVPAATYPGVVDVNWDDSNRVRIAAQPGDYADAGIEVRSAGSASVSSTHAGANGLNRIALSWSAARGDASQNGAAAASDTSVTLPSTVSGAEIRIGRVDTPLGGSVRELYYRAASRGGAANVVALSGGNAPTVGDTLTIVGTPTAAMTQTLLVEAANDVGSDDQLLQLIINPAAPTGTTGGWSRWLTR